MDRAQASHRFGIAYFSGWLLGLLLRWLEPPRTAAIALVVVWGGACAFYGAHAVRAAIRDGSLQRALPEYGWALFGLLVIAAACAIVTLAGLLVAGEPIEVDDVSTGAFAGTLVVLGAWWLLRGRKAARSPSG